MQKQRLAAIHRHWIWANSLKQKFEAILVKAGVRPSDEASIWFASDIGMFFCLWYGVLFVVCEALKKEKVKIPGVQADIDGIYESLRLFRNAVFHIQNEYWPDKLFKIMEDKGSAVRVRRAHDGIGNWLLAEMQKTRAGS